MSDGTSTYTWDGGNHLTAMSGGSTASFVYDPFGRRMSKSIGGTATSFLYDGLNPVQELQAGTPSANLLTGLGIDERFQRSDASGSSSYLSDALGSTLALANESGGLATSYVYDPFGNTTVAGSSSNPYQFTGRENDGTGLYFYRARYYSPTFQRFIAQDPIGFRGGDAGLYTYVRNTPLNLRDPNGKGPIGAVAVGCACLAYTIYSHYSNLSELNQLAETQNQLSQFLDILIQARNESSNPAQWQQLQEYIEQIQQELENLALQYAEEHAADVFTDELHEVVCGAATAAAGGLSPL